MRNALLLLVVPLLLLGCASPDGSTARDDRPAGSPSRPPGVGPSAPGDVTTRQLVTVLDSGAGAMMCFAVAESWPPQCDGPPVIGWDWGEQARYAERASGVRWGEFALRGTWDGATFVLVEAIPAALHDARPVGEPDAPLPAVELTEAELAGVADEVAEDVPHVLTTAVDPGRGQVVVDVTYDDGSLQEQVDAEHGAGVVVVRSLLRDVG